MENKDFTSLAQGYTLDVFQLKIYLVSLCSGIFISLFHRRSISLLSLMFGGSHPVSPQIANTGKSLWTPKKEPMALYWTVLDLTCSLKPQTPDA